MSLSGRTVLVTRPRDQAVDVVREVERRGGNAVVIPTIRILPPESWDDCDQAIRTFSDFDAIVFTSVNAVEYFYQRCQRLGVDEGVYKSRSVYAVGERTRGALEQRGIVVTCVPTEQSGRGLLAAMSESDIQGRNFLVPRGDLAREEVAEGLQRRGGHVTTVTVYRTAGPDNETAALLCRILSSGEIDVVTFFSPSAVQQVLAVVTDETRACLGRSVLTAVIGATTGAALEERGILVSITAPAPTGAALIEEIERFLSR